MMSESQNHTDSTSGAPVPNEPIPDENAGGGNGKPETSPFDDGTVSLLDILLVLARRTTLIVQCVVVFAILGGLYASLAPDEYTSEARVIREVQGEAPRIGGGGLRALQGFGIQLGGGPSGLSPEAYPSVLHTREVRLEVVRDTFYFPDLGQRMTFVRYANRPPGLLHTIKKYTIRLPWTVLGALSGSSSEEEKEVENGEDLTNSEMVAMGTVSQMVATSVNPDNGLMTVSVTAENPEVARALTQSFVMHLRRRVQNIQTQKVKQSLEFIETRFEEVKNELEVAENRLAEFLERNQNANSARLRFERERLQRQVSFKEQLYSELQGQRSQTRLELQRQQPVVTVVEKPVVPPQPSAPDRTLILILFIGLGLVFSVLWIIGAALINSTGSDPESNRKVREIIDKVPTATTLKNRILKARGGTVNDE